MIIDTHYDILNVTRDAPDDLVRAAYLALARKYHPDRNLTNPEAMRMMQLINIAYQALSDPDRRAAHDAWIKQQEPAPLSAAEKAAQEAKLDPKTKKAKADAEAWLAVASRTEKDAQLAHDRAVKALGQAATALEKDKAKWNALAAQASAEEKEHRAKINEALTQAKALADKAGINLTPLGAGKQTHYQVLKISNGAPLEVIRAAYKALAQRYASEDQQSMPATAGFVQTLNEAYKVLSDPEKKKQYDKEIGNTSLQDNTAAPLVMRAPTAKEKELLEEAEKAANVAKAKAVMADRAHEEAEEAQAQAAQAAQAAQKKASDKDAAKWKAWADKLAHDAQAAKARAQKAVADAEAAKATAQETAARANSEKAHADKVAAADAESHARNRAIREAAERAEREKQG